MLLVLLALLIGGTYWARSKSRDEVCKEIKVEIENSEVTTFVTPAFVIEELERKHIIVKNKPLWQINVEEIEKVLLQSQYIETAQCMFVDDGILNIKVSQIVPVMRVFDGDQSYYVNKQGKRMTAVANCNTDVPVVQGHFTNRFTPMRLLPLVQYVERDSALKSLVTMYCINDTNNIILVPSIKGHVINIGNCSDFESKFKKLKLFYNKVMPVKGWMYYDTISVKWNNQIVATRRDKLVEVKKVYDPEDDEQPDDPGTMRVSNNSKAPVNKMTTEKSTAKPLSSTPPATNGENKGDVKKPPEQSPPPKEKQKETPKEKPKETPKKKPKENKKST